MCLLELLTSHKLGEIGRNVGADIVQLRSLAKDFQRASQTLES